MVYNSCFYEECLMNNILNSFINVAKNGNNNFNLPIRNIDYLSEEEMKKILTFSNPKRIKKIEEKIYHLEFDKQTKKYPNNYALIFNDEKFTYEQLDKMSNSLAHYLRSIGIQRNDIIPLICNRSYYYVVAVIGVLKSGAAYAPIDPDYPEERIQYMINEVKPKVILSYLVNESNNNNNNNNKKEFKLFDYRHNTTHLENINENTDLSCIYYTSGTTGKPKGVMITHKNLINCCAHNLTTKTTYDFISERFQNVLSFTKFTFGVSILEIFFPLLHNKTVVLCSEKEFNDPTLLGNLINNYHVDLMLGIPTRISKYLNNEVFRNSISRLKSVMFGGEKLTLNFLNHVNTYLNAYIYSAYGQTECTVTCSIGRIYVEEVNGSREISIGRPSGNNEVYILDDDLKPVPIGVEGDIYISSNGISLGYFNNEELTNETFIPCPFNSRKMYQTGDIGKWSFDGEIICTGRKDFQVKIHGLRIEPSEIDNNLKELKEIGFSITIDKTNLNGEKCLVCYYTLKKDTNPLTEKDLRNYLLTKLPVYMIPSYFLKIDEIPLTLHGKLDRRSLPEPNFEELMKKEKSTYAPPINEIEEKIIEIYSQSFNPNIKNENENENENKIGRFSDFYELGGDSFNVIQICTQIEKIYNIKVTIKDIVLHPAVYEISEFIENKIKDHETGNVEKVSDDLIKIKKYSSKEYPITSQQMGVYIDSIKNPKSISYNNMDAFQLDPSINIEKVKEGFTKLFEKQEILKSKFITKDNMEGKTEIYGIIDDECQLEFEEYIYENAKSFVRPFDLSKAPLIRVGFINDEVLLIDMHHIISDGTTLSIIKNEINHYYKGLPMSELEVQFSDYAIHMEEMKNTERYSKQLEFYREMFKEDYEVINIPQKIKEDKDEVNGRKENEVGKCVKVIESSMREKIDEFIQFHRISKTAFFISIYGYILSKYSGQKTIYSSMTTTNRNSHYVEDMIGMFVSTQPILLQYGQENNSFLDILKETMEQLMELYNHQDISFAELVNSLKLKKVNNSFIFQPKNIFKSNNSEEMIFKKKSDQIIYNIYEEEDVNNEFQINNDNTVKFDIAFSVVEKEEEYLLTLEYNNRIYESMMMENILESYFEMIQHLDKFNENIQDVDYIPKEKRNKMMTKFNDNEYEYSQDKLYHVEFSRIAKENGNKTAIICSDIEINYADLDEMSNSLGHYLRDQNIGKGDIVPIISERSFYFVVATLGVMKSGAAYLPIDPDYPEDRIQFMIEEVQGKMVLEYVTNNENREKLQNHKDWNVYSLSKHNYYENINELENINEPNDLCYVIFTSGTTGKPKGTMITHNNLINYCLYSHTYHGKESLFKEKWENILSFSKFTFDMSVSEILFPLLNKLKITLCNDEEYNDPELIAKLIKERNVDFLIITPTRMKNYIKNIKFKNCIKSLRNIVFGGESIDKEFLSFISEWTNANIYNGYGPTETTAMYEMLKPVPIGVEGEIFIGGYGVGKGYLNQPQLTKEKFIECPYHLIDGKPSRMYRTGDLGKWNERGEIVCLGRIDFQVKIRGQRIELSEIENTIKEMKEIEYSTVIDKNNENGDKYLVCYFISKKINNGKEIREFMKNKLPSYMIPSYFIKIDNIPVTFNGKLDRKSLPEPNIKDLMKESYSAPENEIEEKICEIYSKIFNMNKEEIGRLNDFYELGGDSFNAIQVCNLIEKEFKIKINMRDIFSNSIIYELGQFLENKINNETRNDNESFDIIEIKKRNCKEYPITSQQMGVYIDSIKNPNNITYNSPKLLQLNKNIDIEKIKRALQLLFSKNDILRSKYVEKEINGKTEIYGTMDDECKLEFEEYTYENIKSFVRPFDLSKAPLIRVGFIKNEVLLIDMHHIISDGISISIIMTEINKYYNGLQLSELEVQFSDYAIHMNEIKNNEWYSKQLEFYKEMFKESYDIVNIPQKERTNEYNVNEEKENEIGSCIKVVDNSTSKRINEYVQSNLISKTAFFISIYGYLLSKYSGQDIIYTSMMSANRNNHYLENMIGMFVSTQPVLLKYDQEINSSFLDILKDNMTKLMELYDNQDISFSELANTLKLKKVNNAFIFQPKNIVENNNLKESIFSNEQNQKMYSLYEEYNELQLNNNNTVKFDITFNVIENENEYLLTVDYNKKLYDSWMIENIINSYIEMIQHLDKFNSNIQEIEYIPKEEMNEIINHFNDNKYEYNCDKLYHVEFSRVAEENGNKTAIICSGSEISYLELDEMSNSLGYYLRDQNIGRGDIIPIISERSLYFVVATLAVMKSGAAYLPIDPDYPKDRIQFMIEEVQSKIVLEYVTNNEDHLKLQNNKDWNVYSLSRHNYKVNTEKLNNINEPNDLCYILFTSGTTGKPKGSMITHNNLINYCLYSLTYSGKGYVFNEKIENALSYSKFTHDMFVGEIYYSLLNSLRIILCNDEEYNDPIKLGKLVIKYINIKILMLGGEKLNMNFVKKLRIFKNIRIFNVYGPSETTVISNVKDLNEHRIKNGSEMEENSVGKPLCNFNMYILDKMLKPVPIGVVGEIFIGGYGVGKGYLNQPELTKEKFIECPYHNINGNPGVMYRTGDIGKWNKEGEIVCLGRIDFQIKIRGQRIELSEIDNTIKEVEGIEYSTVIDKEHENGDKYLVCYFVSKNMNNGKKIREYLKSKLPSYMIPNYFIKIDNIPVTSNGKLDRKSLPEPNIKDLMKESYSAPENEIEEKICEIYSNIFNINKEEIGRLNDFYELGGDSFNAIQVCNLIEKEFKIKINMRDIFSHTIIYELGQLINNKINSNESFGLIEVKKRNCKEYPITSQQMGVYIDSIKNLNSIIYNIPKLLQLNKSVNVEKIKEALQLLFKKQDILRSKFIEKEINGKTEIYGIIDDECKLEFEEYTYENVKSFVRPFDLSKAPLIRVGFVKNETLLIDMHHIISDGITMSIIINEINYYYNGLQMSELEVQFSDYAIHMNEMKNSEWYSKQLEFYKEMFKEDYDIINIPKKEIPVVNKDEINEIGNCIRLIDNSLSERINEYIQTNKISQTAFFISIYGYILSKYIGQDIIYTSMMSANRNNHYLENMIGMFVSTQPILLKYDQESNSFLDILKNNMENLMELYNNQDISFSELLSTLKLKKVNNSFIFQPKSIVENNNSDKSIFSNDDINKLYTLYEETDEIQLNSNNDNSTKFDITFNVIEKEEEYILTIEYNKNIYDTFTIENIMDGCIEIIQHLDKFNESIQEIEYIPKEEIENVITKFNDNSLEYDCDKLYHEEFSRVAKEKPESIALIYNNKKYKYCELDEMSNSLAHYLRESGIERNDIVPIICEKSPYYVIGALAVSKAGGAFLPIDIKFPLERIEFILNDVKQKLILAYNVEEITKDLGQYDIYKLNNHDYRNNTMMIESINSPEDTCYILFTSGTTGKPKGALVSHFNIYNFIRKFDENENHTNMYDTIVRKNGVNNMLAIANFPFDLYHIEVTFSLIHGLTIVLADEKMIENISSMSKYIKENQVEFITTTPTRFKLFMENEEFRSQLKHIKVLMFIGESLPLSLCKEIHQYSECKIFNSYGPTECSVTCTLKEIDTEKENKVNIGKPMTNCKVYILDKYKKPVPIGVVGYLYIGGFGVGKGYLGRPETTKEMFVKCPFNDYSNESIEEMYTETNENIIDTIKTQNMIMYNTGDLGKWLNNGEIEYLGRADFQVKIKGQRIELGEIENTIKEIQEIEQCAIIDRMNENDEKYLICYYVMKNPIDSDDSNQGKRIRKYLKSKLPAYMVPNYFKSINKLPVTRNGKLDRKALPEPNIEDIVEEQYVKPENETERKICDIYSSVFNIDIDKIGRTTDFYEIGGDSLNAIRIISKIRKIFDIQISIKEIMKYSTVYSLSNFIENIVGRNDGKYVIENIPRYNKSVYPLSMLSSSAPYKTGKNSEFEFNKHSSNIIYQYYKFNDNIDIEKLKTAFNIIINRHEILKTIYIEKTNDNNKKEIYGKIVDRVCIEIENYTANNFTEFQKPFDLTKDLLIRVGLIEKSILMIGIDHSISDLYSFGILINDLYNIYNGEELEDLPIQYSDYAIYYDKKLKSGNFDNQIKYYKSIFNEDFEIINLPTKMNENKNIKKNHGKKDVKSISLNIGTETFEIISRVLNENNISKTVFFLTIYTLVMSIYSNQKIIYSNIYNSNRTNANTDKLIGCFVTFIPLLVKIRDDMKLIDLMKECMEMVMELFSYDVSFSIISKKLNLPKSNSWFKFDPYKINNNNDIKSIQALNSNEVYEMFGKKDDSEFDNEIFTENKIPDIHFLVAEKSNDYIINILYNNDLYKEGLINDIMNTFLYIVKNESCFNENISSILSKVSKFDNIELNKSYLIEEEKSNERNSEILEKSKNNNSIQEQQSFPKKIKKIKN
ncbi:acetyl-CoA synthetase-like protein [Anaeromyces robustus]|uniref:Acetyl-CoA synthetase-like protein n=1 Tax=Anaeromyces robustus TaxID=1754192 RepID=A0A1Y1X3T5_9FUNG|nr:acetyl-CoA synthetase-like protein [Anaeromyces robustus]|eukprot:ORX80372.1 acetyl-CoA synthetase-like protein [Anaeromyces robustus]